MFLTLYVLAQNNEIKRETQDIQVLFLQNNAYLKKLNVL
jgi:hypothetical protein